jgi:hypothetical protein
MKKLNVRKSPRTPFRPRLELLETRLTPTTYTVSSLADSGPGSLRAAITSVNSDGEFSGDVIDFSVAGVIKLTTTALPAITGQVKIDGTTGPGFVNAPVVEIDSNGFAGLTLEGTESNLSSLSIVNANGPGVTLKGVYNPPTTTGLDMTVVGNWIGVALDGSVAANSGAGLLINNSVGDTIGGTAAADRNVISANGGSGIQLGLNGQDNALQGALILGNYIGTDPSGHNAMGNLGDGITAYSNRPANDGSRGNTIGGTDPGDGNVIAFNSQSGVAVAPVQYTSILGDSIFNNGSQGIGLISDGNANVPAPQLSYAVEAQGFSNGSAQVQVGGIFNDGGNDFGGSGNFTIQIYATLSGVSAGQGQVYLGSVQVTPNANGVASFTLRNASVPVGAGTTFTATATGFANHGGITSVFSNSIGLSTTNQAYVANVYQLLLNRVPEPSASVWVNDLNNGASPASVVLAIEGSAEYLTDQVKAIYELYLHRQPDSGGGQFWVSFLQAGGTFEEVAEGLTSSQEYYVLQGGTNQGFVTGLYQEVLERTPSNAEIAGWEVALDDGASRLQVATAFLTSQEYRTDLIEADYMTFLLRSADSGGLTAWLNALNAGATDQEVLAQIFGSPEGYQLWS